MTPSRYGMIHTTSLRGDRYFVVQSATGPGLFNVMDRTTRKYIVACEPEAECRVITKNLNTEWKAGREARFV